MADLLSYALCSVADVKETLGIDSGDTSRDNLIKRKINFATEYIESYCNLPYGHHFKQATYENEVYDGSGIDQLVLRMRPVASIASFGYRNAYDNIDNWDTFDTEDYFTDLSAGLINSVDIENRRYSSYRVTYTAGYSTIPFDLSEAAASLAAYYVENGTSGTNLKSKREGGRQVEYFDVSSGSSGSNGLIDQLNLDEVLNRYKMYYVR